MNCKHQNVESNVAVMNKPETGQMMAEITTRCLDCGVPFTFEGVPEGKFDFSRPVTNYHGDQLRIAIKPLPAKGGT